MVDKKQIVSVLGHKLLHHVPQVFLLDEVEELSACGAHKIVARHRLDQDFKNWAQDIICNEILDIQLFLKTDNQAEASNRNQLQVLVTTFEEQDDSRRQIMDNKEVSAEPMVLSNEEAEHLYQARKHRSFLNGEVQIRTVIQLNERPE